MTYRISVDEAYATAIGRAVYVFGYLEWAAAWTGEVLQPGFLKKVVEQTAGTNARQLEEMVASYGGDVDVKAELAELAKAFVALVPRRNDLIHATPHTAKDGEQRLLRQTKRFDWTPEEIGKLTTDFEALAIRFNDLFHAKLRPAAKGGTEANSGSQEGRA